MVEDAAVLGQQARLLLCQPLLAGEPLTATSTLRGGAALSLLRPVFSVNGAANGTNGV